MATKQVPAGGGNITAGPARNANAACAESMNGGGAIYVCVNIKA